MKSDCILAIMAMLASIASAQSSTGKCTEVSVEGDATYCINGPICSGAGPSPAGTKCPKKGDVAIKDCLKYLKSYADAGKCVAPVDAQCVKIKTGAWGCVWSSAAVPCTGIPGWENPKPASSAPQATPCTGIPGWANTPSSSPCSGVPGWEKPSSAPSTPCPVIPGWEKPTPASSTPCPVIPGWEKPPTTPPVNVPTSTTTTPPPTTIPPTSTPPLTTTPAPTTPIVPAPILAAVELSAVDRSKDGNEPSNTHVVAIVVAVIGVVAALAVAVVVYKKQRMNADPLGEEPTIYNGAVQTPV